MATGNFTAVFSRHDQLFDDSEYGLMNATLVAHLLHPLAVSSFALSNITLLTLLSVLFSIRFTISAPPLLHYCCVLQLMHSLFAHTEPTLLNTEPHCATVHAKLRTDSTHSKLNVATLNSAAFTYLLGPLCNILDQNAQGYSMPFRL